MRVGVWCRGGSWGRGAEVTLSGCLSRGSRGRDCRVVCACYVYFKDSCVVLGFGLHERCARDVERPRGLRGAGKAVWVWAWAIGFASGLRYLRRFVLPGNCCEFSWHCGGVGEALAADPGSAVVTGPGGVATHWN